MGVGNKKVLSIIVYYTLAALALLSAGFFIFSLIVRDLALWAKILYFVWTGFVIGAIIFDIICTCNKEGKTISGLIIYILSLIAVIMMMILYFMNVGRTGLATGFFNLFLSISLVSIMTTGYMIATWCVGEAVVEHTTADDALDSKKSK